MSVVNDWSKNDLAYLLDARDREKPLGWLKIATVLHRSPVSVRSKYYHYKGREHDLDGPVDAPPPTVCEIAMQRLADRISYHERLGYMLDNHPVTVIALFREAGLEC